jgi:murein DD-endopeptidase MepM/ murein hydrolase activator NlpD
MTEKIMKPHSLFAAILATQLLMPAMAGAALTDGTDTASQLTSKRRGNDGYVLMQDMEVRSFDIDGEEVSENESDDGSQAELSIDESLETADLGRQGDEANSTVILPQNTRFFVTDGVIDPADGQKYIQVQLESGFKFWTSLASFESALYVAEGQVAGRAAGTITSRAGWRVHPISGRMKCHEGTDIAYPSGTRIAARNGSGKVVQAGRLGGYGNCVTIHHADGTMSRYGHLSSISVRVGQTVAGGQGIGRSGCTGACTGPHLHYEHKKIGTTICGGRRSRGAVHKKSVSSRAARKKQRR